MPSTLVSSSFLVSVVWAVAIAAVVFLLVTNTVARRKARAALINAERQNAVTGVLSEIGRDCVVASRESAQEVRAMLDRTLRSLFPSIASIAVFDIVEDVLRCSFASGHAVQDFLGVELGVDQGSSLPVAALRAGEALTLQDARDVRGIAGDRWATAIPLSIDKEPSSILYISSKTSVLSWEPVQRVVRQGGPSYVVALERDEMRAQLTHDPLTGLLNRRAFNLRLNEAIDRGLDVVLGFIDLDGFKGWNDSYGHQSGDNILRQVADIMRAHVLNVQHDLPARLGGDEFCVAFIGRGKSEGIEQALRLGAAIYHAPRHEFIIGEDRGVQVTACIGVAACPDDATDAESLIESADELMYYSKTHGKDRVSYRLEDHEIRMKVCSEIERRDYQQRPSADRRLTTVGRPFAAGDKDGTGDGRAS